MYTLGRQDILYTNFITLKFELINKKMELLQGKFDYQICDKWICANNIRILEIP